MDSFISYAQNREDVMLWRALGHVKNGTYVDVGANEPVVDSVTKAFYVRGWRGINIEPVAEMYERLTIDRPGDINIRAAVASHAGTADFFEFPGTGLSTMNAEVARSHRESGLEPRVYTVPVRTIKDIFDEHHVSVVHFMKVDVEGAEEDVLRGMCLEEVKPWILLIEATAPNTQIPAHGDWEQLVVGAGYTFVFFDGTNRFYVSDEHPELADAFLAPPNSFDNFIPLVEHQLREQLRSCQSDISAILSSWSWRLTKPLRAPKVLLRRFINGDRRN